MSRLVGLLASQYSLELQCLVVAGRLHTAPFVSEGS